MASERELIALIARRVAPPPGVLLGIGDDAALLAPPESTRALAASCDALVEGSHFLAGATPEDLGWKALAVNLSDLAAMGAQPRHALLALTLPDGDVGWLQRFLDGFLALAEVQGVTLVGGNLARGPRQIAVTVLGEVAPARALRRSGGRPGDRLWVTGCLGGAAAALAAERHGREAPAFWRRRLWRPEPRVGAGLALAGLARAAIDLSDGLLADLMHLCEASGVGAELDLATLPLAPGLEGLAKEERLRLALSGGEDYELLLALPPGLDPRASCPPEIPLTAIGYLSESPGIRLREAEGAVREVGAAGWDHFATTGNDRS